MGHGPDVGTDPLAKQGTLQLQLPVSAGRARIARLAILPYRFSHPGRDGPAVLDQETPAGDAPEGKPGNALSYAAVWWALSSAGSSLMPGPMVVLTVTDLR